MTDNQLRLAQESVPPYPTGQIPVDPQPSPQAGGMWQPARRDWREWHGWPWIAIPAVLFLAVVGVSRLAIDTINAHTTAVVSSPATSPAMSPATSKATATPTATPSYDLAGYQQALTGSQAQAYGAALRKLRADYRASSFATASTDAGNLIYDANVWLVLIRGTNPPPSMQGARASYMAAIVKGRKAGSVTQAAITSTDPLTQLPDGAALTVAALAALNRVAASSPTPTGS